MTVSAIKKITPVLFVPEVEPCIQFWVERFGFTKIAEVPEGDKIGFAILKNGDVELMYESYPCVDKDIPSVAQSVRKGPTFLYVEVEKVDDFIAAAKGAAVAFPVRTTFYGAKEIGIKDPAGHFVTFSQMGAGAESK